MKQFLFEMVGTLISLRFILDFGHLLSVDLYINLTWARLHKLSYVFALDVCNWGLIELYLLSCMIASSHFDYFMIV